MEPGALEQLGQGVRREAEAIREGQQVVVREQRGSDATKSGPGIEAFSPRGITRSIGYPNRQHSARTQQLYRGADRRARVGQLVERVPDRHRVVAPLRPESLQV